MSYEAERVTAGGSICSRVAPPGLDSGRLTRLLAETAQCRFQYVTERFRVVRREGDVSKESRGLVQDDVLLEVGEEFALQSQRNSDLIARSLSEDRPS